MGAPEELRRDLQTAADPKKTLVMQRFFKTGRGQCGEGDMFIGLTVPRPRLIAKKYSGLLLLQDIKNLPHSEVHEERLIALLILVQRFRQDPEDIAKFYLDNLAWVNNWDLVDSTAPCILGACLKGKDLSPLYRRLVKSDVLWERKIAVVATLHFIHKSDFSDTLKIARLLLYDKHDLMQGDGMDASRGRQARRKSGRGVPCKTLQCPGLCCAMQSKGSRNKKKGVHGGQGACALITCPPCQNRRFFPQGTTESSTPTFHDAASAVSESRWCPYRGTPHRSRQRLHAGT